MSVGGWIVRRYERSQGSKVVNNVGKEGVAGVVVVVEEEEGGRAVAVATAAVVKGSDAVVEGADSSTELHGGLAVGGT